MATAIGIDLGTTNSAAAFINDYGRPEIIVDSFTGSHVTPSVVQFDEGHVLVGTEAKNSAVLRPLDTVQFVKRQMGNPDWRFIDSTGKEYTAEEVSAQILRRIKLDAERVLGGPIEAAVISVPAYFDDARRRATQDAGKIAGLEVLRIINEPTAAAIAYGLDSGSDERILVYDLGGGTFDVTAMQVSAGSLEVVATGGDANLGGFDWDNELMGFLNEEFMKRGGPDLFAEPSTEQDLRSKAEEAKKKLSQIEQTNVQIGTRGVTEKITITRTEFESRTAWLLDRTSVILDQVREEAGWRWDELDKVLLVGGSTRMPQVNMLVRSVTGHTPSSQLHPDEVVAMGASIQAALLASPTPGEPTIRTRNGQPVHELTISDVTAHSLGVLAVNPDTGWLENSVILPKNTRIPASASDLFSTIHDRQQLYECEVTEGEERNPEMVRVVGRGDIRLPGTYRGGAPMQVSMAYDADGIVHVFVHDLVANRPLGELHIDRKSNLTPSQVIDIAARQPRMELE